MPSRSRLLRGGEGGIRTRGSGSPEHALSRRARSTTPAPLLRNQAGDAQGRTCRRCESFRLAERAGFEPAIPEPGIPVFETGAFNHSATSPSPKIVSKAELGPLASPAPSGGRNWPIPPVLRVDTFKTPYLALSHQLRAQNVIRTCSKSMKPHVSRLLFGPRCRPALSDPDSALTAADPRPEEVGSAE